MIWRTDSPIYIQLEEIISNDIVSGKYALGAKLPSVRALAEAYTINPNTVVKVYANLEAKGIITSKTNSGFFVTEKKKEIKELKLSIANKTIEDFILKIKNIGVSLNEAIALIKEKEHVTKD